MNYELCLYTGNVFLKAAEHHSVYSTPSLTFHRPVFTSVDLYIEQLYVAALHLL